MPVIQAVGQTLARLHKQHGKKWPAARNRPAACPGLQQHLPKQLMQCSGAQQVIGWNRYAGDPTTWLQTARRTPRLCLLHARFLFATMYCLDGII